MIGYRRSTVVILAVVLVITVLSGCTTESATPPLIPAEQSPGSRTAIPVVIPTPSPELTTEGTPALPVQEIRINLTAENGAFSRKTITVPAGAQIILTFINRDTGIPHNFALYTDRSAATKIYIGDIVLGTGTATYTFRAPAVPGTYFFRCDLHPAQMTGSFVVT